MPKNQWHADYFLTCGECRNQEFIEGGPLKRAIAEARRQGYKKVKGVGWVCPKCLPKNETPK